MVFKGAIAGVPAAESCPPEKRKSVRGKKDRSKVQTVWFDSVSKTRDRYPLPSLHFRISFTEMSRRGLGKWNLSRRSGNDNIEVVRTKSQAGMLRPHRVPTIYKSNSRLVIDPLEHPLPERARPESLRTAAESEKHSVIVDLPERVEMHIASPSSEKHSVVVEFPNKVEITLSSRVERVEEGPSRFEELNDDASVHELEAVFRTASTPADDIQTLPTVVLCEADDPTAFPTLQFWPRSFTMDLKQDRPKISITIPRSKSLNILPESGTSGAAFTIGPPSPPSCTTLYRSLTQLPAMRYSLISPQTPIDMPQPMRPYSTISVPLFMEAADIAQATEEVPPLPTFPDGIMVLNGERYEAECSNRVQQLSELEQDLGGSPVQHGRLSSSSPTPSEDADVEDDDIPTRGMARSMTRKTMAESINKPLPPEPQVMLPTTLSPLAYKPRPVQIAQGQESLPRSRYSPNHRGKFEDFKKQTTTRTPSLDQAIQELERRLSYICEQRARSDVPRPKTPIQVSRGLMLMQPSRSPPPIPRLADDAATRQPRRPIVRSNSVNHIILQSRDPTDKSLKTRSCQDLKWRRGAFDNGELPTVEEAETWYRTASERSSADLSSSVFSDAGTDGTCQTDQSNGQDKPKEKIKAEKEEEKGPSVEKECVIDNTGLPQAMQSSNVQADVAEGVILRIMSNLTTLKDLFATAALNKGFYNTFKRHEMFLIKATLFKSSVAAWELREISEDKQITPTAYLRQYSVEIYTMGMLKTLIILQCESFLRPTTIAGLVGNDPVRSAQIDAAFWRVWTFCRRFGSSAGEEEDIEAQVDWLNGGEFARERDPSTCFGIGNGEGLSKGELYDMTELWTCLSVLVQNFHGRIEEARAVGIYDNCKVDADRDEELFLEEWTWYLLTRGPSCILALTQGSFATAKELGMTNWTPPAPGPASSRSKFFKKALTRVYEERQAEEAQAKGGKAKRTSKASHRMTKSEAARELDRARQTAFAEEIRYQRKHSPNQAEPLTFDDERPMSVYSAVVRSMAQGPSQVSPQDLATMPKPCPLGFGSSSRPSSRKSNHPIPTSPSPETPPFTSSSALPSASDDDNFPITPTIIPSDAHPNAPIITLSDIAAEKAASTPPPQPPLNPTTTAGGIIDPTDRAMWHLVEVLGFDAPSAKWALTHSETGHGIDVKKAVEMLVNGSTPRSRPSASKHRHDTIHPVEVDPSSVARPSYTRRRNVAGVEVGGVRSRDSIVTTDEMDEKEKERANIMRMREKSYRVLGIGSPLGGRKMPVSFSKRLSRR